MNCSSCGGEITSEESQRGVCNCCRSGLPTPPAGTPEVRARVQAALAAKLRGSFRLGDATCTRAEPGPAPAPVMRSVRFVNQAARPLRIARLVVVAIVATLLLLLARHVISENGSAHSAASRSSAETLQDEAVARICAKNRYKLTITEYADAQGVVGGYSTEPADSEAVADASPMIFDASGAWRATYSLFGTEQSRAAYNNAIARMHRDFPFHRKWSCP